MNILVTGGAGFIASQIADAYIQAGHQVTIVDDLSTGSRKNVNPKATFVPMDVRDPNIVTLFERSKFDVVNHHAAQIDVRRSMQDPFVDASINILGTLRLLDCCRSYNVQRFILASSGGTIYGECPAAPAVETEPGTPESPYGFSKAAAETYLRFYGAHYGIPYVILRYGNVYGPRQDPKGEAGVVAIFCSKLLADETATIYGDGQQERDYVYVKDIVAANVAALARGKNDVMNIGTGQPVSVNQLFKILLKLLDKKSQPVLADARAGELKRSVLNAGLAKKVLGWQPARTLEQGLQETLDHFRSSALQSSK